MHDRTHRRARAALVATSLLLVSGAQACHMSMRGERRASATMFDAAGRQLGVVTLTEAEANRGVVIAARLQGLAAGEHGMHFHTVGTCDAGAAFASAGGHFNPSARKHGLENPTGPHAGDLPNFTVSEDGMGTFRETTSRVTLAAGAGSLLDADGSAIVIHATSDDQRTDPAGNSGARIACGVVKER